MRDAKGFDYLWWVVPLTEVVILLGIMLYYMRLVGT